MSQHEHPSDYPDTDADTVEACAECDRDTPHAVSIEVRTETDRYGGNQPYRITECLACELVDEERIGMGN